MAVNLRMWCGTCQESTPGADCPACPEKMTACAKCKQCFRCGRSPR